MSATAQRASIERSHSRISFVRQHTPTAKNGGTGVVLPVETTDESAWNNPRLPAVPLACERLNSLTINGAPVASIDERIESAMERQTRLFLSAAAVLALFSAGNPARSDDKSYVTNTTYVPGSGRAIAMDQLASCNITATDVEKVLPLLYRLREADRQRYTDVDYIP